MTKYMIILACVLSYDVLIHFMATAAKYGNFHIRRIMEDGGVRSCDMLFNEGSTQNLSLDADR